VFNKLDLRGEEADTNVVRRSRRRHDKSLGGPLPPESDTSGSVKPDMQSQAADAAALVRLYASVVSRGDFAEAAQAAAAGLAGVLGFDRVAIGVIERGYSRVVAISHGAQPESSSGLAQAIGKAMDEAVTQEATLALPPPDSARMRITLAHAELVRRHDGAVCTVPMVRNAVIVGAVTLQRARADALAQADIERCEQFISLIGPALDLMRISERPWYVALLRSLRPGDRYAGKAIALALTLFVGAMLLVPVGYWVGSPARLEGAIQRSVVAPAEGYLKAYHVRPGDAVSADQVLAEMVEQDLQLEQKKLEGEMAQHEGALRGALARGDRTLYATSTAKLDSATAQLALIEQQRIRAQIRAPFDGVVIKGDLTQSLGAPVQRGEVLFTVAPAGQFRLIVEVDERDIGYIKVGQKGVLALSALPGNTLDLTVSRITPLSTARDGRNFFEVEARPVNLPAGARPGLQGVAKIYVGERAFGWVWTHRLFDWVRLKLWTFRG
jgi:hypothetical protein